MAPSPTALLRLHQVPGIGQRTLDRILTWIDESGTNLEDIFDLEPDELARLFRLDAGVATALRASSAEHAELLADELDQSGFRLVLRSSREYPAQLSRQLAEKAPPVLYIHGTTEHLTAPGLAFAGSRHSSPQGLDNTVSLVQQAVKRGLTVISGHAPGVDATAHRTALDQGGVTVMVPPEGALTFKLRPELREAYERRPQNVVVVSQFPPRMPWSAQNAMIRNQVVIGLAQALCVIEASDTGGSLRAGRDALRLNIPVFALRYQEPPVSATGNGLLIAEGAQPVATEPKAVLPDLSSGTTSLSTDSAATQLPLF